jgi:hypothetical protein
MSETQKTTFELDLDSKEFLKGLLEAKGAIGSLGDVRNLDGLLSSLGKATVALGALTLAAYAVGKSFEAVFEAENIKAINAQFDQLTKNAGISGEALRKSLDLAAQGLLDDEDALEIANRAIVNMGASAERLGELLESARKIALSTGRDVKDTFDGLTRAVEFQNQRAFKQLGLNIDLDKAYRRYADAMGIGVKTLSEAAKQEAILNEIQEVTRTKFSGNIENVKQATTAWIQFKVAVGQIGETIVLFWDKTVGPTVIRVFKTIAEMAKGASDAMKLAFGDESEKAAIKTKALELQLASMNKQATYFKEIIAKDTRPRAVEQATKSLQFTEEKIKSITAQLEELKGKAKETEEVVPEAGPRKKPGADPELAAKAALQFKKESLAIEREITQEKMRLSQDEAEITELFYNRQAQQMEELSRRQEEIRQNDLMGAQQKADLIVQIEEEKNAKIMQSEDDLHKEQTRAAQNRLNQSKSVSDGIANAAKLEATKSKIAMQDFGKVGSQIFTRFSDTAVDSLMAIGEGTFDAGETMKKFFFGMLSEQAEQYGKFMLLSSIWPPNPVGMAGGAAMLVLAGFLRGQAGGGAKGGGGGGDMGGGGYGAAFGDMDLPARAQADQESRLEESQQTRKAVTIQVMGNYFETEQTKRQLAEIIREHQDATDFTFKQIGTA